MDNDGLTSADIKAMWEKIQECKVEKTTLTLEELRLRIRRNAIALGLKEPTEEGIRNAIAWMFRAEIIEFDESEGESWCSGRTRSCGPAYGGIQVLLAPPIAR